MQVLVAMIIAFHASLLLTPGAQASTKVMPLELVEFATRSGCAQVDDFFDRVGMVNPPYVYGYLPGPKDKSAVFWCQTTEGGERQYYLMSMSKEHSDHESARCPPRIKWKNPPGGLDIYSNQRESLAEFVFLDNPRERAPRGARLNQNAIRSEYDGASEILYCYKGRWLIRWRH